MNKQFKAISLSILTVGLLIQAVPVKAGLVSYLTAIGGTLSFVAGSYYTYISGQKAVPGKKETDKDSTQFDRATCMENIGKDLTTVKDTVVDTAGDMITAHKSDLFCGVCVTAAWNSGLLGMAAQYMATTARAIIPEGIRTVTSFVAPIVVGAVLYSKFTSPSHKNKKDTLVINKDQNKE